jgi:glutathione S-transferase
MMLELWQTEWCHASHRIRERLTELGIDYVAHQVPVRREERGELVRATGASTIPVLVLADGEAVVGEEAIGAYLDGLPEPPGAETHRLKAATARRRYLEEECEC